MSSDTSLRFECVGRAPSEPRRLGYQLGTAPAIERGRLVGLGQDRELLLGRGEIASVETAQRGVKRADDLFLRRAHFALARDQLEDLDRLSLALDRDAVEPAQHEAAPGGARRRFADQDPAAVYLVGTLEARGQVHRIADYRVVQPRLGSHVADDRVAGVDANAGPDRR